MIEVEHPTLGVLEFPDGTSQETIKAAIQKAEQKQPGKFDLSTARPVAQEGNQTMNVELPNGRLIEGVPVGTSKEAIKQKAIAAGIATEQDFSGQSGGFDLSKARPAYPEADGAGAGQGGLQRLKQAENALVKADAAGDVEGARTLAAEVRRLRAELQTTGDGLPLTDSQRQAVERIQASPDKGGFVNFVTGNDRTVPGIEEIDADQVFGDPWDDHPSENFKVSAGTLLTFDDEAKKNIWSEQLQSAGIEHRWAQDPFGNAALVYKDPNDGTEKIGYLNKAGWSMSDAATTAAQIGAYAGAGKAARAVPWVGQKIAQAGAVGRAGMAGGGAATQSLASDAGANTVGADIPGEQMARNALVAGAAGTVLNPIGELAGAGLQRGAHAVGQLFKRMTTGGEQAVAATKELVMQNAGDYRAMFENATPDFWARVHQQAQSATTPEEAFQSAVSQAFREQIPGFTPLRPHVTGQPSDFAELDKVSRGGYGGQPQDELRVIQKDNETALAERARTIREEITGQGLDNVGDAGTQVRQGLRDAYDVSKAKVNEAYDIAGRQQGQFRAAGVESLPGRLNQALESGSHKLPGRDLMKENYPATTEMLGAVETLRGGDVPIQQYEQMRRYLQGQWRGAKSSDRAAAASILREFDTWADDMLDQAMYAGDEAAMESLKGARAANREHMAKFGKNDTFADGRKISDRAGKVVNDIIHDDLSPVAVINYMAGSSKMGQTKDAMAVLGRLHKAVGVDSPAWSALQEAGLLRLFYDDAGRLRNTGQVLKRWDQMYQGDGRAWAMRLYGPSSMNQLDQLMKLMRRTQRDSRDYVPSGPAIDKLTDTITQMAGRLGISAKHPLVGGFVADVVDGLRKSGADRRMAREGQEAIHAPVLRYMPEVNFSRAIGTGMAGTGSAGARSSTAN
ncbi:hypothetical protein [Alcanivorax sp.]|uniref:hypothetical protein n=1 Tax=Alcanivorax sp. TaxID=1872427 RepID=UPI0025B81697|nr:hypothetical protein [Alcanivorax sp.]